MGGVGGGGFGGGGFSGRGTAMADSYDGSVQAIENEIKTYLDGQEIKNILTPGEYSEWPLTLKAGQVVIAEARSDAFDPALEIVDDKQKVMGTNDDRYPGDQRPLLLWRCETAGSYSIRGRCFRDKAGGQFFLRFVVMDSYDLDIDRKLDTEIKNDSPFLLRIPMKAGQIRQPSIETSNQKRYAQPSLSTMISPTGLPDIQLAKPLWDVFPFAILAPVDGDYYVMAKTYQRDPATILIGLKDVSAVKVPVEGGNASMPGKTGVQSLWTLPVKKGQILEVSTPELTPYTSVIVSEEPSVAKYDLKKPDTNPFYPSVKNPEEVEKPAIHVLPSRARDQRTTIFVARRDANLWVASSGWGDEKAAFNLRVQPAIKDFAESKTQSSQLRIGNTDYWAFDAKLGDVMTFDFGSAGFAEQVRIIDPELQDYWVNQAIADQTMIKGSLIARKAGRYLVAVSSIGDGGGGEYTLARTVYQAKEFSKASPAKGDFANGQTQVWKFTAKPNEPLLLHWTSSDWDYSIVTKNAAGMDVQIPLQAVSGNDRYAILKVEQPTEYMIVLTPYSKNAKYTIELNDLPGIAKK